MLPDHLFYFAKTLVNISNYSYWGPNIHLNPFCFRLYHFQWRLNSDYPQSSNKAAPGDGRIKFQLLLLPVGHCGGTTLLYRQVNTSIQGKSISY